MLQNQFYIRLILIIVVGLVYVSAYIKMAKRNSKEIQSERHLVLKILGGLFALIGLFFGVLGIFVLTQIRFPSETIDMDLSSYAIVRSASEKIYFGYATMEQSQCITIFNNIFHFLALSAYCFLYKSSHSTWYIKIGKVIFCIIFYMFYVNATNFHYLDIYEFMSPVLFAVMAYIVLRKKKESKLNDFNDTDANKDEENTVEDNSIHEDLKPELSCPLNIGNDTDNTETFNNEDVIEVNNEPVQDSNPTIQYCRNCGRKIDYKSDKYCKYCGKSLY